MESNPLLESVSVKLKENACLSGLARLLIYFNQHYKQLFVDTKLYLKHFNKIEIQIENISSIFAHNDLQRYPADNANQPQFFQQGRSKEYSIDDNTIKIQSRDVEQGIASFGTVYENIFDCLQRVQEANEDTSNVPKNCSIVVLFH